MQWLSTSLVIRNFDAFNPEIKVVFYYSANVKSCNSVTLGFSVVTIAMGNSFSGINEDWQSDMQIKMSFIAVDSMVSIWQSYEYDSKIEYWMQFAIPYILKWQEHGYVIITILSTWLRADSNMQLPWISIKYFTIVRTLAITCISNIAITLFRLQVAPWSSICMIDYKSYNHPTCIMYKYESSIVNIGAK